MMVSPETEAKQLHRELMARAPPGGVTPTSEHVLLGRGKSHLNHMGNVVRPDAVPFVETMLTIDNHIIVCILFYSGSRR